MKIIPMLRPQSMGLAAAAALFLSGFAGGAAAEEIKLMLSGNMEVPPVMTQASGKADLMVNADGTVSGKVMTSGVAATMAHIHHGKAGSNGPVILPLAKDGDNGWMVPAGSKLSEADMKAYMAGELYINVHSDANKGGEIRGQLMPGAAMGGGK